MPTINLISDVVYKVRDNVLGGKWDDLVHRAMYDGCGVGVKLAHEFGVDNGNDGDNIRGIDAFAKAIGGNRAHVILMFREAGIKCDITTCDKWGCERPSVWDYLSDARKLPELAGADLREAYLGLADLRDGYVFWSDF